MNDYQEDKLGMYEKILAFLLNFATELTGVSQIAGIATALEDKLDDITDAQSVVGSDTSGYTMEKDEARKELTEITLKVSRAAAAYFLSIGNVGKIKLSDYTPTELEKSRDNDLYAKAKKLFKVADPVKANLTGFNSGPADVTDLDTSKETFFDIIQLPATKRGEITASVKDIDKLMGETDQQLDLLDIYMATFAATNANMYSQYQSARAIDLSGGGGSSQRQGQLDAGSIAYATFGVNQITADTVFEFKNVEGNQQFTFYFGTSGTSAVDTNRPLYNVGPGMSHQVNATDAGFDLAHKCLNIFNAGTTGTGKWQVIIVS